MALRKGVVLMLLDISGFHCGEIGFVADRVTDNSGDDA
jgi:hypothetical protein